MKNVLNLASNSAKCQFVKCLFAYVRWHKSHKSTSFSSESSFPHLLHVFFVFVLKLKISQTVTSANSTCFWRGAVRILSVTTARTVEWEQREWSRVGNDGSGWKTSTWNWQKRLLLLLLLGILTFLHTKGQHDVKLPHQCGDRVIHCTEFTSQVWFFSFFFTEFVYWVSGWNRTNKSLSSLCSRFLWNRFQPCLWYQFNFIYAPQWTRFYAFLFYRSCLLAADLECQSKVSIFQSKFNRYEAAEPKESCFSA